MNKKHLLRKVQHVCMYARSELYNVLKCSPCKCLKDLQAIVLEGDMAPNLYSFPPIHFNISSFYSDPLGRLAHP